ncbi:hypothetical protein ACQPW1_13390 [Nocardia sp. CA-128927]|uniref:hypothetical protein n=1 Tax=Nocardia sp. CA-128927 TaxID=3239975 RepID=UPI003D97D7B8
MAEAENTGESAPVQSTNPIAAAPEPPSRLAARWRGSRPLRIASAVLVAVVIGGVGFGAGLAVGGGDGNHHGGHQMAAAHRFGRDDGPGMHRSERGDRPGHGDRQGRADSPGDNGSAPAAPVPPTTTPTPSPTH